MDPLLTPKQVQAQYGIAAKTLANYRWQGIGPKYVKTHPGQQGRVKYRRSAIDEWITASTVQPGGTAA
ncbi:helix-turn-helix transcriptional regulator [Streptomyces sp. NPDC001536]|uniref:helix-turn-helix transcriptional regulator n=1 Tax=Streptomyces sp. NPDC001536 TaxID=3364583 RepID=UPI00368E5A4F